MKRPTDLVSPSIPVETIRPKERAARIQSLIEKEMARIKERDHHWEDGIEVSPPCAWFESC